MYKQNIGEQNEVHTILVVLLLVRELISPGSLDIFALLIIMGFMVATADSEDMELRLMLLTGRSMMVTL